MATTIIRAVTNIIRRRPRWHPGMSASVAPNVPDPLAWYRASAAVAAQPVEAVTGLRPQWRPGMAMSDTVTWLRRPAVAPTGAVEESVRQPPWLPSSYMIGWLRTLAVAPDAPVGEPVRYLRWSPPLASTVAVIADQLPWLRQPTRERGEEESLPTQARWSPSLTPPPPVPPAVAAPTLFLQGNVQRSTVGTGNVQRNTAHTGNVQRNMGLTGDARSNA